MTAAAPAPRVARAFAIAALPAPFPVEGGKGVFAAFGEIFPAPLTGPGCGFRSETPFSRGGAGVFGSRCLPKTSPASLKPPLFILNFPLFSMVEGEREFREGYIYM